PKVNWVFWLLVGVPAGDQLDPLAQLPLAAPVHVWPRAGVAAARSRAAANTAVPVRGGHMAGLREVSGRRHDRTAGGLPSPSAAAPKVCHAGIDLSAGRG